ncbi:MAG: biotin--[acetyl-CoA-carboxylase] ligase [Rickettsiales bacterium]|jgi:BirA family biotin operon repressor/biotin-[acetyl-CoA-carboxylase] ligase|nr:biotin--[acetyl-CoA-carboxylase] ligase [Rickettsiales bacterium]
MKNDYKLYSFDKISSTQSYAIEMIARGVARDKIVIMAAAQSAGRGRGAHKWVSHHGNLYASFIYKSLTPDPRLSYAIAVALAETLIKFGIPARIKWPNDIFADGKKIAGVLIEYVDNFVVAGIGLNINTNPTLRGNYLSTKTDNYQKLTREELLSELMIQLDFWRAKLKLKNFNIIRKRWTSLAIGINSKITYRGQNYILRGINESGGLVLGTFGTENISVLDNEILI